MNRQDFLRGFQLHYHQSFNEKIQPITAIKLGPLVFKGQGFFSLKRYIS